MSVSRDSAESWTKDWRFPPLWINSQRLWTRMLVSITEFLKFGAFGPLSSFFFPVCWSYYLFPAANLFKLLLKYRPEDKAEKKQRLLAKAQAEADGKTVESKKPIVVKYGLNHITYLIEQVWSGFWVPEPFNFAASCSLSSIFNREKPSWWLLLMMLTPLSWLCGFQPSAVKWEFLMPLLRGRLVWELLVFPSNLRQFFSYFKPLIPLCLLFLSGCGQQNRHCFGFDCGEEWR